MIITGNVTSEQLRGVDLGAPWVLFSYVFKLSKQQCNYFGGVWTHKTRRYTCTW